MQDSGTLIEREEEKKQASDLAYSSASGHYRVKHVLSSHMVHVHPLEA